MNQDSAIHQIVIAGAGYAGLHVALRLATRLQSETVELTLVDQHDYHQILTELPRITGGTRAVDEVRIPLDQLLSQRVTFVHTTVAGFDLPHRRLLTEERPLPYDRLVLALGSKPNDFDIPGLAKRVLPFWSVDDAERVQAAVQANVETAAHTQDPAQQQSLLTVVIGGGGATGVELAGELAEELPRLTRLHGLPKDQGKVVLVEAGHTILPGSSPELIAKANQILDSLGVIVRTNAAIAAATPQGFKLKSGEVIEGGVFIWAGGVKAPDVVLGSGLQVGPNGRIKVDQYLQALEHPEIFVAGDLAAMIDPETGHVLPPLAQIALEEGETVFRNLLAEIKGQPLEPFRFENRGLVVSVGEKRGVADVAGRTVGGRLAHVLKDAIEWEYRQSVKHLHGWSPV